MTKNYFSEWTQDYTENNDIFFNLIKHFAKNELEVHFDDKTVSQITEKTHQQYKENEPNLLRQKSFGASITIRMACYSVAFYNSLLSVGKNKEESIEILYNICWDIYKIMGDAPMIIANAISSNKHKKMEIATQIFRIFPFSSPDYIWEDVESDNKTVAFDCKQCRVAEYFMDNNIGDVCYNTWCKLDFPLAEKWGGKLERKGSIANGNKICDFRWKTE